MAGFAEFRCTNGACRQFVLKSFRKGSIRPIGDAKIVGVDDGSPIVECPHCSTVSVWTKKNPAVSAHEYRLRGARAIPVDVQALMQAMEKRWALFMESKARGRAELAVGLRFDVFSRDGFRCQYCGVSARDGALLHVDHVIPESKGGPTTRENLVTACVDCNLGKSDKDLSPEAVARLTNREECDTIAS